MDVKDLIETLATIGIFAISVGVGLCKEAIKKRRAARSAPKSMPLPAARPPRSPETQGAVRSSAPASAAPGISVPEAGPSPSPRVYSFTPEEEGGCSLDHDHRAGDETTSGADMLPPDVERRELLRTLIIGEVLASPRFRTKP